MAELYQEGIELKPGCFSMIEQQDFVLENGKMAKKYRFEPTNPKEDLTTNNLPKSNDSLEKDNNMDYKTIETLFTYHPAPDLDVKQFEELREGAKYLGKLMIKYGKRKDDTSLAIQKLRESIHFAISSIVVPEDGE